MTKPFPFSWKFFLVCFLVVLAGGIVAASTTGWIDLRSWMAQVPVLAEWAGVEQEEKPLSLEEKNERLRSQMAELEKEVKRLKEQEVMLQELQKDLEENEIMKKEQLAQERAEQEGYRALAAYYADIKPSAAVAILDNLDPQIVAEILQAMDKEQAGQILAAMEPVRAADLLKIIADRTAQAGAQINLMTERR